MVSSLPVKDKMMGQELATKNFNRQWSAPPLPAPLLDALALVKATQPTAEDMPLVDAGTRAQLPALAAAFEAGLDGSNDPEMIEGLCARYSMAFPPRKNSDAEAGVKLDLYVEGLADIPEDVLREAFKTAVRECTFFPTVKELRDFAKPELNRRLWRLRTLQGLVKRFDMEPPARDDLMPPEVAKEKLAGLRKSLAAALDITPDEDRGRRSRGDPAHA